MNLMKSLLILFFCAVSFHEASADITSRPSAIPHSAQKLTFKQKWRKFFMKVSDDFHMESPHTRMADKFHEELRKPKTNQKLSRKERKALERANRERAKAAPSAPSSEYQPYPVAPVSPNYQPVPSVNPEPLGYDPVAP